MTGPQVSLRNLAKLLRMQASRLGNSSQAYVRSGDRDFIDLRALSLDLEETAYQLDRFCEKLADLAIKAGLGATDPVIEPLDIQR